ncbi:MAG: hypothetical protein ABIO70_15055 [Pseudomonadota bacterium]
MRTTLLIALLPLASACHPEVAHDSWVEPGCGDGVLQGGEGCDDGAANSDTDPDACRLDCQLPVCGDAVEDAGEACDDGSPYGGDGCTPLCTLEEGAPEQEPNDTPEEAEIPGGSTISGYAEADGQDCFALSMAACQALAAHLVAPCPVPATLSLYHPDGSLLATGGPGEDGCAAIDPLEEPGARFLDEGSWALCVSGLLGAEVPFYTLAVEPVAVEDAHYELPDDADPDGDGYPDQCDDDRDGDGVLDDDDDCPDVPDGPEMAPMAPSEDGWLRQWLTIGPFTGTASPSTCLPTAEQLVGEDDAAVWPALGDVAGGFPWIVLWGTEDRVAFEPDYATVSAPREVYQALYVYASAERALTLSLGPDDGARAWLDEEMIWENAVCQGTVMDHYTVDVSLPAGWSRLMIKVYDQGGGWGNYVRFLQGGEPVTDLELSLSPEGSWAPGQSDMDGDGVGDVCDTTPHGA